MIDRLLESVGIMTENQIIQQGFNTDIEMRRLTADYVNGEIRLEDYQTKLNKLPGIDLRKLARKLL